MSTRPWECTPDGCLGWFVNGETSIPERCDDCHAAGSGIESDQHALAEALRAAAELVERDANLEFEEMDQGLVWTEVRPSVLLATCTAEYVAFPEMIGQFIDDNWQLLCHVRGIS